jgi:hypothetical protein
VTDSEVTRIVAEIGAFTGIGGLLVGVVGLILSLANRVRDSGALRVELSEAAIPINLPQYPSNIDWGLVNVSNSGRRPLFLVAVDLILNSGETALLFASKSKQLTEGGEPSHTMFDIGDLRRRGQIVCARARDSRGKSYYSRMKLTKRVRFAMLRLEGKV